LSRGWHIFKLHINQWIQREHIHMPLIAIQPQRLMLHMVSFSMRGMMNLGGPMGDINCWIVVSYRVKYSF
jgi:hypothetical protein